MTQLEKRIAIQASPETIATILDNPEQAGTLNPHLNLRSHTPSPLGGFDSTWEYRMGGMTFSGATTMCAYERGKRMVYESTGGIDSRWEWMITPDGQGTAVTLSLAYTVPGALLGAAFNKLILERQNEKTIEEQLANLKLLAEKI